MKARRMMPRLGRGGLAGETTCDTALELGYRMRLMKSDYNNIKVTTRWDLTALRAATNTVEKELEQARSSIVDSARETQTG
jgi:hypothetical protein